MASNLMKKILELPNTVNDTDDDSLIGDFQASYVRNVDFKPDGFSISKGYSKYSTYDYSTNEVQSMVEYQKDGTKTLFTTSNSTLKRVNNDNTVTDIGALASNSVESANINCTFDSNPVNDKVLLLDGTDYKYYDGTSLASVPSYSPTTQEQINPGQNILSTTPNEIKQAKYIALYMNRVWLTKGRNLRFSDTSTGGGHIGNYFPATYVFSFPLDITGFIVKDKPIVFTDSKVYIIKGSTAISTDLDRYRYEDIQSEYGCSNHRTIGVTNNGVIWLHRKGVYRLITDGENHRVQKISKGEGILTGGKIQKFIDSKTDNQIKTAFAVVGNDEYKLKFDDGTMAVFNLQTEGWTFKDTQQGNCGINFDGKVLFAGRYIWQMDNGQNYDGQAIVATVEGKNSNLGIRTYNKDFDTWFISVRSELSSYDLTVGYDMDWASVTETKHIVDTISKWGEMKFGDKIRTIDITLNREVQIRKGDEKFAFKWKISGSGLNHYWQVINMFLEFKQREMS